METDNAMPLETGDVGKVTLACLEADPRGGRPGAQLSAVTEDGREYPIAGVFLTDARTSNAFAAEIARRFNALKGADQE